MLSLDRHASGDQPRRKCGRTPRIRVSLARRVALKCAGGTLPDALRLGMPVRKIRKGLEARMRYFASLLPREANQRANASIAPCGSSISKSQFS